MDFASHVWESLASPERILIILAFALLTLGFGFIVVVFLLRSRQARDDARTMETRSEIRKILNTLLVDEVSHSPSSAIAFKLSLLRKIVRKSDFKKQILIDQIIELKKNLTGSSVASLVMVFNVMKLYKLSLKKLGYTAWHDKAKGIRELAEMQHRPGLPLISPFVNSNNQILREEAILALLHLSETNPLTFLDSYEGNITLWMRLNLHRNLQKLDVRKLPNFSHWFGHKNETVVLFSLSMARAFRQLNALPEIVKLLNHRSERVVGLAVETIGVLEADEYADTIANLLVTHSNNPKIITRVIQALGGIGSSQHQDKISGFLRHESYNVRFETMRSLQKLGLSFDEILNDQEANDLKQIAKHLSEPLLS